MLITLIRGFILYISITFFMRFMGKRQLGELQPTELVITILLSEIAAIPMENNDSPLLNSLFATALLVCLEIINSVLSMKSQFFSRILQGKSAVIIENGILNQKKLKDLRFSIEDLLEQLRQKDCFDIKDVNYAVVETNGNLSLKKKNNLESLTAGQFGIKEKEVKIPVLAINDGKLVHANINGNPQMQKQIESVLKAEKIKTEDAFILLITDADNYTLIKRGLG